MYINAVETAIKYLVAWFGIYLIYFLAFAFMRAWNQKNKMKKISSLLFCIVYSFGIAIFYNIRSNGILWDSALTGFIVSSFASLVARYNVYQLALKARNIENLKRIITEDYTEED
jgi:cytochrome c biogenesis factor